MYNDSVQIRYRGWVKKKKLFAELDWTKLCFSRATSVRPGILNVAPSYVWWNRSEKSEKPFTGSWYFFTTSNAD